MIVMVVAVYALNCNPTYGRLFHEVIDEALLRTSLKR
jgi:hypothetical protein